MLESEAWAELRRNIAGPHWVRIESPLTGEGIPDVNAALDGVEIWCELKSMNRGVKVPLRSKQAGWLLKRSKVGGRCFIYVRIQKKGWGDGVIIWRGEDAREVKDQGLNAVGLAVYHATSGIDWAKVRALFFEDLNTHRRSAWA